ncbi:MAG: DUF2505 family protein [Actinobacteria bacterium]|nr:DUF2505 family protein [Actinomycetota bacterium]
MRFDATHTLARPITEVIDAFLDADAHVTRYEGMGSRDVEVLHRDSGDSSLTLKTVRVVEGEVPKVARKFIAATNTITTTDTWTRSDDGVLVGTSLIEASNVPGTATIAATLRAEGAGTTVYDIVLDLALDVPLVGDRFVALLRPKVMEIIDTEFAAWDEYFSRVGVG